MQTKYMFQSFLGYEKAENMSKEVTFKVYYGFEDNSSKDIVFSTCQAYN